MLEKIKQLFLENSYCFRKFWVYQFVISLLGVMVTLPLSEFISLHPQYDVFPYLLAVLFCGGVFCFLIYDIMFSLGAKDYIRVQSGKAPLQPFKGLYICLIAYIPTFIVALFDVIFALCGYGNGYTVTHVILNVVIHAQYSGFMFLFDNSLGVVGDVLALVFAPLFGSLAYYLAIHDKTLRSIFGIKVKHNKE